MEGKGLEMVMIACTMIVVVVIVTLFVLGLAAVVWAWSNGVLGDPRAARELLERKDSRRAKRGSGVASSPPSNSMR